MASLNSLALFALVALGRHADAWYYHSSTNAAPSSAAAASTHLLKHQFLLPPYPTYQHDLLHQPPPPPAITVHDNRYYGSPGEFAEPSSYNELNFEGPYEVTAPRIPGLYFRLSSGVFVPVKAVYSFPPFLERLVQRIQGYYSVYNPPESLGLDRPGVALPPTLEVLPVLPPQHPADVKPQLGHLPPPPPGGPLPVGPLLPKPSTTTTTSAPTTSSTTESTKEETTPSGEDSEVSDLSSALVTQTEQDRTDPEPSTDLPSQTTTVASSSTDPTV